MEALNKSEIHQDFLGLAQQTLNRAKLANELQVREIICNSHRSPAPKPGFHWKFTLPLLGFNRKFRGFSGGCQKAGL
jgi:hypothetical protein